MTSSSKLLLWSPRVLGILVCVFLGLFSLDAFENGKTVAQGVPDFAMHVVPVLILLVVVGVAWRWAWVGAFVFIGLAAGYAYVSRAHVSWIVTIAGPLLIVGILFFWSWLNRGEIRANR